MSQHEHLTDEQLQEAIDGVKRILKGELPPPTITLLKNVLKDLNAEKKRRGKKSQSQPK